MDRHAMGNEQQAEDEPAHDRGQVLPAGQADVVDAKGPPELLARNKVRDDRDGRGALHRDRASHHPAAGGEGPEAARQAAERRADAPDRQRAGKHVGAARAVRHPAHGKAKAQIGQRIGRAHQEADLAVGHVRGLLDRLDQERDQPVVELAAEGDQRDHHHGVPRDRRGQPLRCGLERRALCRDHGGFEGGLDGDGLLDLVDAHAGPSWFPPALRRRSQPLFVITVEIINSMGGLEGWRPSLQKLRSKPQKVGPARPSRGG